MRINNNKIRIMILILIVALFITFSLFLMPFVLSLADPINRENFKSYINSLGTKGYLVMIGLQIIQVVIAFIPGEIVEILMGMMYGIWEGLFIYLLGSFIGTFISYTITKILGKPLIVSKKEKEEIKKYQFLMDEKKIGITFFIIFFIPGTPKDIFNYIAPFTKIKMSKYLLISTFARLPSIISSLIIGNHFVVGNYYLSLIFFIIGGIAGIIGLIYMRKYVKNNNKNKNE